MTTDQGERNHIVPNSFPDSTAVKRDAHAQFPPKLYEKEIVQQQEMLYTVYPGGGGSHIKVTGVLVGFFSSDP